MIPIFSRARILCSIRIYPVWIVPSINTTEPVGIMWMVLECSLNFLVPESNEPKNVSRALFPPFALSFQVTSYHLLVKA
jgi:hypothetical protein